MHKDSHIKPLHDATAQMAVDAQMQRHKWLSMHRCNGTNGCRGRDAPTTNDNDCRTESPQSVLIGIENKHFFEKQTFSTNKKNRCGLSIDFL